MAQDNGEKSVKIPTNEMQQRPFIFDDGEPSRQSKLTGKIRDNPFFAFGMLGFFGTVLYGIRGFKNRPKHLTPSMYIVQFRVYAQGFAVCCMTAGVGYTILKKKFWNETESELEKK